MTDQEFATLAEALFQIAEPMIRLMDLEKATGRRRAPIREAFLTICDKFYSGQQWRSIPLREGRIKGSTAHSAFQNWTSLGLFGLLHAVVLKELNTNADYVLQDTLPELKKTRFLPGHKLDIVRAFPDNDEQGHLNKIVILATMEETRVSLDCVIRQAQERARALFAQHGLKVAGCQICMSREDFGAMEELLNLVLEQSR